ncbi:MAG TPA: nucleotide sugar dehydrogenase [Streptosporangiaceae bacterium]|jgi:UDP-N-acetyl-D-glucosamine dehydrogenase|nr:nucleotide sugar dehydrogenase [Streptosporangiaceae bacterium]
MAESALSLAVNGREHQLEGKLVLFRPPVTESGSANGHAGPRGRPAQAPPRGVPDGVATWSAAIMGLGYVGLPTAAALHGQCGQIIGIDVNPERLRQIEAREADLAGPDRARLEAALDDGSLELTCDPAAVAKADVVIICVPTPVNGDHVPDLRALRGACESVVAHARPGQTVILTSTTYVGTTRELLAGPLQRRGLRAGSAVFVAFSPERIDPGNPDHVQRKTPRVVGGVTPECARRAATVIGRLTDAVYLVSSPDAAEATKLYENIFRAVSLALANEFADACGTLSLDPVEVTLAAGTKPYGFLGALPGPGVGGHCIPCDPHYLLWQLGRDGHRSPLIEQAMTSIRLRPGRVAERARQVLAADGRALAGARVIVVGVSYKAGVQDLRESSALPLIAGLMSDGADVGYYDPLIPRIQLPGGAALESQDAPAGSGWDLAVVHTLHPGADYSWVPDCLRVLDATYQFDTAPHRVVV